MHICLSDDEIVSHVLRQPVASGAPANGLESCEYCRRRLWEVGVIRRSLLPPPDGDVRLDVEVLVTVLKREAAKEPRYGPALLALPLAGSLLLTLLFLAWFSGLLTGPYVVSSVLLSGATVFLLQNQLVPSTTDLNTDQELGHFPSNA